MCNIYVILSTENELKDAEQNYSTDISDLDVKGEERGKMIKEKFGIIYRILILKKLIDSVWKCYHWWF